MIYKSIFIDLDDTLWDTYHNNKECLEELYTDYHFNRYYASFEAFFDIYWPHNNLLWEQYRNNEIDRQTLIIERFRYMLRPLGIEDTKSVLEINNDFLQRTPVHQFFLFILSLERNPIFLFLFSLFCTFLSSRQSAIGTGFMKFI